jgi:hypothetical protein
MLPLEFALVRFAEVMMLHLRSTPIIIFQWGDLIWLLNVPPFKYFTVLSMIVG